MLGLQWLVPTEGYLLFFHDEEFLRALRQQGPAGSAATPITASRTPARTSPGSWRPYSASPNDVAGVVPEHRAVGQRTFLSRIGCL
jgi:hypothetical protein